MLDRVGAVGDARSAGPVAHDDDGLAFPIVRERAEHGRFRERVEVGRGLVEQHERRVVQEDACEADALSFASREEVPQLADGRVDAVGQTGHERGERCLVQRFIELGISRVGTCDEQVVADGAREQVRVLGHEALGRTQARGVDAPDVLVRYRHHSAVGVPEAHDQLQQRGLPRAAPSRDLHDLTRLPRQVHVFEDARVAVGEVDVAGGYPGEAVDVRSVDDFLGLGRLVDQVEHACARCERLLEG